jgi:hypothetical protein
MISSSAMCARRNVQSCRKLHSLLTVHNNVLILDITYEKVSWTLYAVTINISALINFLPATNFVNFILQIKQSHQSLILVTHRFISNVREIIFAVLGVQYIKA